MNYKTLPMPAPPATQALSSSTFEPPPLDGSLTVPEMYDWHLDRHPDHPLLIFSDSEHVEHTITWGKGVRAIYRIANKVTRQINRGPNIRDKPPTVVAILSAADTITYFLNIAGIFRAGYTAFPISPRNSAAAVAHLLLKGGVTHILVGAEASSQSLCTKALDLLDDSNKSALKVTAMPTFDDVYTGIENSTETGPKVEYDLDCPVFIVHSSGSTAFPKPITWTHYRLIQLACIPYFGERDMCGTRFACQSMPMFHGMGIMQTGWTAATGIVITGFQPRVPAILPSPDAVIESSIDTKSDIIFCVPSFVEAWSRNKEYISSLRKIQGILYGGGPLNQEVGDLMSNEGISIFILYGSSEVGVISPIIPKPVKKDWNYFPISRNIKSKFIPDGHGHYELIIIPNPYEVPSVFNTKEDDVDAYATSDLLVPHPTIPGYWKLHGRVDDQLMHSTGEKTNPGPLENILNQDPHIQSSVMFGRGRFNAGVIVDPKPEYAFDPSDVNALGEFRKTIWSTVEELNEYAPQHSRIFKEMILVSSPSKPFTYTAKNTVRRQAVITDFADEIDALYAAVHETAQADLPLPKSWTSTLTLDFIRNIVTKVMKHDIKDDIDFFRHGCDSLQATWIRNTILNALQVSTDLQTRSIPINFVYHYPTIASLAAYISSLVETRADSDQQGDFKQNISAMESMVLKYSTSFGQHTPTTPRSTKDILLITGTTGGLGSLLLTQLLQCSDVERIYALNRGGGDLSRRQANALTDRGINAEILKSPKLVMLEADLEKDHFGLDQSVFEDIRKTVTHIVHNAYPVNFNLKLSSFEPSIMGLRKLVDLALSSPLLEPPRLLFTSSISVVRNTTGSVLVPEEDVEASAAVGVGYPESKWTCERILRIASSKTPLKPIIVRIGQMSGMSKGGHWNSKEWVPALIKSSIHVKCLPKLDQDVSWIPIDTAAQAIIEMRDSPAQTLHLAHPHPVSWQSIFLPASQELGIPLISYDEWLHALDANEPNVNGDANGTAIADNPALRIIDFFRYSGHTTENSEGWEAMGLRRLSLDKALEVSATLRQARLSPLSSHDVKSWLVSWRDAGFISF